MTQPAIAPSGAITPAEAPAKQKRIHGYILFVFAILLALALGWHLMKELEILYVSALFAVVLMPIVKRFQKIHIKHWSPGRGIAIVLLIATVGLALLLFFWIALPPVARDLRSFVADAPGRIPQLVAKIKTRPLADRWGVDSAAQRAQEALAATAGYLFNSLPNWLSHVLDLLTTAFLSIYFMLEGGDVYEYFLSLFEPHPRARLNFTLQKAEVKMSKWLLGQGLLMLILGVCSTVVFGILHVRYFVLLGVLMGLLNIIPIAGGVITIILAGGIAALDSWPKMAGVFIFYAIYINIENAVLTPRIMKSSVDLMGITVLVALLIGTALAGIVGALVAVPTAALISVLLDEYVVKHDPDAIAGAHPAYDEP